MNLVALLEKLERIVPSWLLAFIAISLAVGYLFYSNPLHNLCNTQVDQYWSSQDKFLGLDKTKKMKNFMYYEGFYERCKSTNSAGGCYQYFDGFQSALRSYKAVDDSCKKALSQRGRFKKVFTSFLKQVPRLAWGDEGPMSTYEKNSWLSSKDIRLYCNIRNIFSDNYGESTLKALDQKILSKLPNPKKIKKSYVREYSLIGVNCSQYY